MKGFILATLLSVMATKAAFADQLPQTNSKEERCLQLSFVVWAVSTGRDLGGTPENAYAALLEKGLSSQAATEIVVNVFYKMADVPPEDVAISFSNYCMSEAT